jgi:hypothetical protein
MAVATAWKRNDTFRKHSLVMMKMTYDTGDTSVVCDTGLSIIYNYSISPTSVTAKKVNFATVAGGIITITVADPLAPCYLFVTAEGI